MGKAPEATKRVPPVASQPHTQEAQMFNSILTIANSFDTQPDPGSIEDTDPHFTAPMPDSGELLAAAGVPAHAIREVLASRTCTGADG